MTCLNDDQLQAVVRGTLSETEIAEIETHLECCEHCQRSLDVMETPLFVPDQGEPEILRQQWREMAPRMAASMKAGMSAVDLPSAFDTGSLPSIEGYDVVGLLGRGGMGTVFDAVHQKLHRSVAIKVLPDTAATDPKLRDRFSREMQVIGQLDHANIVKAYDAGEKKGRCFLVMERIDGVTVAQIANRGPSLSVADACEIIRQAACGLGHAHEKGLVHRDIKPSNLMVTVDGIVKILDLGLARHSPGHEALPSELTASGQILGTIDYMSPEQVHGERDVDHAADLYGLGATLYRLVAGRPVFHGAKHDTTFRKLSAIIGEDPVPVQSLQPQVPDPLAELISRMIAKDPQDRPKQATEVARLLEPFCESADLSRLCRDVNRDGRSTFDYTEDTRSRLAAEASTSESFQSGVDPTLSITNQAFQTEATKTETSDRKAVPDTPRGDGDRRRKRFLLACCLGLIVAAILGMFVFEIQTQYGVLVVKPSGKTFKTSLQGETVTIENTLTGEKHRIELTGNESRTKLPPGDYVWVKTAAGLETLTDHFVIRAGDDHQIEVWWKPKPSSEKTAAPLDLAQDLARDQSDIPPPSGSLPVAPADVAERRKIAEWVLENGGQIHTGNPRRECIVPADLPAGDDWSVFEVWLRGSVVTDQHLEKVAKLKMVSLKLFGTGITAPGLIHLRDSSVVRLSIIQQPVPDSMLDEIASLAQLEGLDLESVGISASGLFKRLRLLKNLESIAIAKVNLSEADFGQLRHFLKIERLYFDKTGVTDSLIPDILATPSLRTLELIRNQLTDQGILPLAKGRQLRLLVVGEPNVTPDGLDALRQALPEYVTLKY